MAKRARPSSRNHAHARPRPAPAPACPAMAARLTDLVSPVAFALGDEDRPLGLRARIRALPVMVAVVLTMIWRQVPSVSALVRTLRREDVLWAPPRAVSQQARRLRRRPLPAARCAGVLAALIPTLRARAAARTRPLPPVLARARTRFGHVWAVDGTTLAALCAKVGLLRGATPPLGGKLDAVRDLTSKRPGQLWRAANPAANDTGLLARLKPVLPARALVIGAAGFDALPWCDWLTAPGDHFLTRARAVTALTVDRVRRDPPTVRDRIVRLGQHRAHPGPHPVRQVAVRVGATWHA